MSSFQPAEPLGLEESKEAFIPDAVDDFGRQEPTSLAFLGSRSDERRHGGGGANQILGRPRVGLTLIVCSRSIHGWIVAAPGFEINLIWGALPLRDGLAGSDVLSHTLRTQPVPRLMQLRFVHDVVAVKDRPRPVTGQLHRDALGHACPDQIAGCGATAIVQQPSRHPRPPTRFRPGRPPRPHRHRIPAKHGVGARIRWEVSRVQTRLDG